MIRLRWEAKRVHAKLAALQAAMSGAGLSAFISGEFSPVVRTGTETRFANEGDDAVGKWRPLLSSTQRIRENLGYPAAHPINVRSGRLKAHVTQSAFAPTSVGMDVANMRYPGTQASGQLYNKMLVAQGGGESEMGNAIAARPVLSFRNEDAATMLTMLAAHFEGVMRAA